MEKFQNVLSKFGFSNRGGSSDEAEAGARRSTQSTPRMSRARVRGPGEHDQQQQQQQRTFGSLGSMEVHRVNRVRERSWESDRVHRVQIDQSQAMNRSWDIDKVPGLDRNWQSEQARGLELVYRSMEKEKERRLQAAQNTAHGHRQKEGKKKKRKRDKSKESQAMMEQIDNNKLSQERLERRIDELNRMLLEEKHQNRKDKLAVAKLQQEVARQKSDRSIRETLMKELERERMLRLDAERRLRDMTIENDNYKARLLALQEEFKKMDEMGRTMLQFKNKVDQLKQEKASLSINYEKTMQKFRTEISNFEHENKIVTAELKRLESQCNNCQHCNKDLSYRVTKVEPGQSESSDKVKMLLERLKRLEEEKSQLVLENENQRQQYEKCLDEIANQVVQALLSQKGLREECGKLQKRVLDLEEQNRQLKDMFHLRMKFASDSLLQQAISTNCKGRLEGVQSDQSLDQTKFAMFHGLTGSCDSITPLSQISLGSLQSICSNYHENSQNEGSDPGKPKPSSPPPWLRDQVHKTDSPSSSVCSPASVETMLSLNGKQQRAGGDPGYLQLPSTAAVNGKTDGAKFHGHMMISHNAGQSAFHPVGQNSNNPPAQVNQNNEGADLSHQIAASDQAHLHMMHIQNMALQHQRQNSLQGTNSMTSSQNLMLSAQNGMTSQHSLMTPQQSAVTSSSSSSLSNIASSSPNLTSKDGQYIMTDVTKDLSSISDVDMKLINSIQNAKKRFSQGLTLQYEHGAHGNHDSEPCETGQINGNFSNRSQIETEFPADNTSPKMKHTSLSVRQQQRSRQNSWEQLDQPVPGSVNRRNEAQADVAFNGKYIPKPVKLSLPGENVNNIPEASPGKRLLKMSDSFQDKFTFNSNSGPQIGDFLDSDSDDSDTSRPLSKNFSMASTMSLNELLEKGLENVETPMDENFSIDNFQIFDSDEDEGDFKDPMERMKLNFSGKENGGVTSTPDISPQTYTNKHGDKFIVDIKKNEQSEKDYGDYVCLRKIREYVYMNMPEVREQQQRKAQTKSNNTNGEQQQKVQNKCSHTNGDCKSSQTSPELEELCRCGSCDNVFDKSQGDIQPMKSTVSQQSSRSNSRSGSSRPSELHLLTKSSVDALNSQKVCVAEIKSTKRTKSVDSDIALKSSYHDYVNLSPEMVQEILSRESTPQKERSNSNKSSCEFKTPPPVKPKPKRNLTNDSGIADSHDISKASCDIPLSNDGISSGDSPDSAMQRSYTSTGSSENRRSLEQLKYGKDEGYSSNSANSVKTDSVSDMLSSQESKKAHRAAEENCNNNSSGVFKEGKDMKKNSPGSNKVHVAAEVHAHFEKNCGSLTSLHSVSSVESECNAKKVKDIKDYFENKMEEVRVSMEKLDSPKMGRKSFRNVPKTSPFHQRPYGYSNRGATSKSLSNNCIHSNSSLIPKPCLIKHVLKRSHSTSCVMKMEKLTGLSKQDFILRRCKSLSDFNQELTTAYLSSETDLGVRNMVQSRSKGHSTSTAAYSNSGVKMLGPLACTQQHMHVPNKLKMGVSSRRKSESEERRIVGEGSETGYRSREELRPEGVVIQKYEEEGGSVPPYKDLVLSPSHQWKPRHPSDHKSSTKHSLKHLKKTLNCFRHTTSSDEGSSWSLLEPAETRLNQRAPVSVISTPTNCSDVSFHISANSCSQTHNNIVKLNLVDLKNSNNSTYTTSLKQKDPVVKYSDPHEADLSSSNTSGLSSYGESSPIEESVKLLNTIGIPDDLQELEKQYQLMQENLKQKMTATNPQKCFSLNNINVIGGGGRSEITTDTHCLLNQRQQMANSNFLKESCSLPEFLDLPSVLNDVCFSANSKAINFDEDDITAQIESLSKTVDDIQRSLSSLSVDTLVGEEQDVTGSNSSQEGDEGIVGSDKQKVVGIAEENEQEEDGIDCSNDLAVVDINDVKPRAKKTAGSFLSTLVMLSSSDEDDGKSATDALWDSLEGSIEFTDTHRPTASASSQQYMPVSLFTDFSPSPTSSEVISPPSPVIHNHQQPFMPNYHQPYVLPDDCLSSDMPGYSSQPLLLPQNHQLPTLPCNKFSRHNGEIYESSDLNCSDHSCIEKLRESNSQQTTEMSMSKNISCKNCSVSKFKEISSDTDGFHYNQSSHSYCEDDVTNRFSNCHRNSCHSSFSFPQLNCEPPRNKRIDEIQEESRIEQETNITRISDASFESTNSEYKTVSNAFSESNNGLNSTNYHKETGSKVKTESRETDTGGATLNDLTESLEYQDLYHDHDDLDHNNHDHNDLDHNNLDNDMLKSCDCDINDDYLKLSNHSHDCELVKSLEDDSTKGSKFKSMFYSRWLQSSFESTGSSIGVDGLSLSDSYCDSIAGQESE